MSRSCQGLSNFFEFMLQTPSTYSGKNVIPYQFWDQSWDRIVCPQARQFKYLNTGIAFSCTKLPELSGLEEHYPGLRFIPKLVWDHILTF